MLRYHVRLFQILFSPVTANHLEAIFDAESDWAPRQMIESEQLLSLLVKIHGIPEVPVK